MAYDLLLRRQTPRNWSCGPSLMGFDFSSSLPPEYREAYEHASKLARAREDKDKKAQITESKWLAAQGWSIQETNPGDTFQAIIVSNPKFPKKIRVNLMS